MSKPSQRPERTLLFVMLLYMVALSLPATAQAEDRGIAMGQQPTATAAGFQDFVWSDPRHSNYFRIRGNAVDMQVAAHRDIGACKRGTAPMLTTQAPASDFWTVGVRFDMPRRFPASLVGLVLWDGRESGRVHALYAGPYDADTARVEGSYVTSCDAEPRMLRAALGNTGTFDVRFAATRGWLKVQKSRGGYAFFIKAEGSPNWQHLGTVTTPETFDRVGLAVSTRSGSIGADVTFSDLRVEIPASTPGEGLAASSEAWRQAFTGSNRGSLEGGQMCIDATDAGDALMSRARPYNLQADYTVAFDFRLSREGSAGFRIYDDGFVRLVTGQGASVRYQRSDGLENLSQGLQVLRPDQWYGFKLAAHPSRGSCDVYINGGLAGTVTGISSKAPLFPGSAIVAPAPQTVRDLIRVGKEGTGSGARAEGCWKTMSFWQAGVRGDLLPVVAEAPAAPEGAGAPTVLSCRNGDNEEGACCCSKDAHTYHFSPRPVAIVRVTFDTGRGLDCKSKVRLEIDRGQGWKTIERVKAVSSAGTQEFAPMSVDLPVNKTIQGVRIRDKCDCCIDFSEVTLYPPGMAPGATQEDRTRGISDELEKGLRSIFK